VEEVNFEGELFRLIPSRFPPVSVYEGLVANDRLEDLVEVENATNPRLHSEKRLRAAYPDPAEPKLQNWNLAPFKYLNPEGSRFFDPTRPALELADDRQTALAVSLARRQAFPLPHRGRSDRAGHANVSDAGKGALSRLSRAFPGLVA